MIGAASGSGRTFGHGSPLVYGIHLTREQLQTPSQVPLILHKIIKIATQKLPSVYKNHTFADGGGFPYGSSPFYPYPPDSANKTQIDYFIDLLHFPLGPLP